MSERELVLEAVSQMPEQASMAEILDELALLAGVNQALAQSERGGGLPHEEVLKMLDQ
jgi:predicted transcriptional regulator